MTDTTIDVVDDLAAISPGGSIDALRRRRPVTRDQLQASFDALFAPVDDREFPLDERELVAAFATRLTAADETAAWFARRAERADADRAAIVLAEASVAATSGPYGVYREAGLAAESVEGLRYAPTDEIYDAVGDRLAAALAHAHLLTYRPREADDVALGRLLAAGWSVEGIVTLSQLVSFLAFQQRVAAGLRALAETEEDAA